MSIRIVIDSTSDVTDEIIEKYGADTLRVYEMFMGPFEQAIIWNEQGVKGVHKFLNRLWDFVIKNKDENCQ